MDSSNSARPAPTCATATPRPTVSPTASVVVTPTPVPTSTSTPTATIVPTPTPTIPVSNGTILYDITSPWNTAIVNPIVDPKSATYMTAISDNGLPLTSDPDQYTIPVYTFTSSTPFATVRFSGYYSTYDAGDNSRVGHGYGSVQQIPIPVSAIPPAGSDAQVELLDTINGVQYGFWQLVKNSDGTWTATNGYRYHTTSGYYGRFADGLAGRGAGTPYLAGLVRKWEIDQGHIDHALDFAYHSPAGTFVYPASKSDGANFGGVGGVDIPEGTRIQLNPIYTEADFTAWGLSDKAKIIARALQTYGMYVIDNSGSSKIYLESRLTAGWGSDVTRSLVSGIPWSAFRVISGP